MSLRVEGSNSRYGFIGDLASICGVKYFSVCCGGGKFVSRNVSNRWISKVIEGSVKWEDIQVSGLQKGGTLEITWTAQYRILP
jgi:hypothetical protein